MKPTLCYTIVPILIIALFIQAAIASDFKELEMLVNHGDAEAMYELGEMYENGVGTIQNYVEAHKWYNISASRGYVKARKARDAVAKKMNTNQIEEAQKLAIKWKPSKGGWAEAKAEVKKQTPLEKLFEATRDGDVQKVKALLKSGIDPNIEISGGIPILFVAVHENRKAVVEVLIESGADVNAPLKKGMTLLMIAIKDGHKDIVEFLIEKRARLDVKSGNGDTPLSLAEAKGLDDIVALIRKTGGFVEPKKTLPPETIFRAAENGDVDMLRKLFDQGVDPNMTNQRGWFPLMFAAYSGHKEAVETLIEAGAEINKQAPDASTALITATLQGNVLVVKTLLDKGTDRAAKNSLGMTALTVAKQKGYTGIAELMSGSINLKSNPSSAKVYIKGKYETMTPATIAYLVPGRYRVEIKKNGYKTWSDTVSVSVGKETGVFAQLKKEVPRVSLRSYYKTLSESQLQSIPNIIIKEKKDTGGFFVHSPINHDYEAKTIKGDKVVIDHATGLMWHQSGSKETMKWDEAKQLVNGLNKTGYAGYSDWRLPTLEEAASLSESKNNSGLLYIDIIFKNQSEIWTGDREGSDKAWCIHFRNARHWSGSGWLEDQGGSNCHRRFFWESYYVRPVRSVK